MQHTAVPQRPLYRVALNTGRDVVVSPPGGGIVLAIAISLACVELLFLAGVLAESSRGVASLPSRKSETPENCIVLFLSVYFGPWWAGLFGASIFPRRGNNMADKGIKFMARTGNIANSGGKILALEGNNIANSGG